MMKLATLLPTSSGEYRMHLGLTRVCLIVVAAMVLPTAPALARDDARPITDREPDALDVAKTPMTDLNIGRTEIPALLMEAEKRPYSVQNLSTCTQLAGAIEELNLVLGPDLDLPQSERVRFSKGRIAQWAVGKFIPFRSLIREVSGANRQEREIRSAIQAGLARRGFLKGVGAARNCPYPASPATETIVARHIAAMAQEDSDDTKSEGTAGKSTDSVIQPMPQTPSIRKPVFVAQPVIQPST